MNPTHNELHRTAQACLNAGMCALPAIRSQKRPAIGRWKPYCHRRPTEEELSGWFAQGHDAVCLVCGQTSGNLEIIDFDAGGALLPAWKERIAPELLAKLVIERTPSGGAHAIYRCETPVCGNLKLAQRRVDDKILTLIETRGEGGLFLCAPTPGYSLVQGDLASPPVLTGAERELLLQAAWELNEYLPPVVNGPPSLAGQAENGASRSHDSHNGSKAPGSVSQAGVASDFSQRPGDDYNARGDVRALLARYGWSLVRSGENEYWRRPGKTSGWSATLKDRVLYVFSANAAPFEPSRAYSPFAVYALLEHGGDYEAAARSLRMSGYGSDSWSHSRTDVDLSGILGTNAGEESDDAENAERPPDIPDPGPMPAEMLRIPGFVSEVMDLSLATAPYPNPVMAFAGALSLLAFLAARKVRDPGDNRTNIYILGLAHSAAGKDWPRKINNRIVHEIGLSHSLGERFASGEGIQDALFQTPAMLFQTDEVDGMLQSINKSKDARHEAIMSTLLTMFSSSNSVYPMRRKAGKENPGVIDQPGLVIFGTAIPNHYYQALSERMLTNGFFARMLVLESGPRPSGQEPSICEIPPRILSTARWWANYMPGKGNLEHWHPIPQIVQYSPDATQALLETRARADAEYAKAESGGDSVGTTVWGRVSEQVRKLALLYAISENHLDPCIDGGAVRWASEFVMHQTRRMLFMAAGHVAENPFHAECLKLINKLRQSPDGHLGRNKLLRTMHCKLADFEQIISTLIMQGDIVPVEIPTKTKTAQGFRLP